MAGSRSRSLIDRAYVANVRQAVTGLLLEQHQLRSNPDDSFAPWLFSSRQCTLDSSNFLKDAISDVAQGPVGINASLGEVSVQTESQICPLAHTPGLYALRLDLASSAACFSDQDGGSSATTEQTPPADRHTSVHRGLTRTEKGGSVCHRKFDALDLAEQLGKAFAQRLGLGSPFLQRLARCQCLVPPSALHEADSGACRLSLRWSGTTVGTIGHSGFCAKQGTRLYNEVKKSAISSTSNVYGEAGVSLGQTGMCFLTALGGWHQPGIADSKG